MYANQTVLMQVSIWPVTIPLWANLQVTNFSIKMPTLGTAFQCKPLAAGSKNETKSPPLSIICLVRMLRYQWKRNISLEEKLLSKFSIIVRLTTFLYRENKVFASLYTTDKNNTAIMQQFEDSSKIIVTVESQGIPQWLCWHVLYTSFQGFPHI